MEMKHASIWNVTAAMSIALFAGCAAMKATQQPDKKDMAVLTPGIPRTSVIAELGAPVWTGENQGATTDVFKFRQGYTKEVKAGRAVIHGVGDVLTFGLWEVVGIPAESLANGTEVQLEITYDAQQNVQSVTVLKGDDAVHPKPMFAKKESKRQV